MTPRSMYDHFERTAFHTALKTLVALDGLELLSRKADVDYDLLQDFYHSPPSQLPYLSSVAAERIIVQFGCTSFSSFYNKAKATSSAVTTADTSEASVVEPAPMVSKKETSTNALFGQTISRILALKGWSTKEFANELTQFQARIHLQKTSRITSKDLVWGLYRSKETVLGRQLRGLIYAYFDAENIEALTQLAERLEQEKTFTELQDTATPDTVGTNSVLDGKIRFDFPKSGFMLGGNS